MLTRHTDISLRVPLLHFQLLHPCPWAREGNGTAGIKITISCFRTQNLPLMLAYFRSYIPIPGGDRRVASRSTGCCLPAQGIPVHVPSKPRLGSKEQSGAWCASPAWSVFGLPCSEVCIFPSGSASLCYSFIFLPCSFCPHCTHAVLVFILKLKRAPLSKLLGCGMFYELHASTGVRLHDVWFPCSQT